MRNAILSYEEMEGSGFLLPLTEGVRTRMREPVLRT